MQLAPYHYLSGKVNSILFIPTASFFGSFEQLLEPTMSQKYKLLHLTFVPMLLCCGELHCTPRYLIGSRVCEFFEGGL